MAGALIEIKNTGLAIPDEKIAQLESNYRKGLVTYLSPEPEAGAFYYYMMGNTLEEISNKMKYPLDVVILTALYYQWPAKLKTLGELAVTNEPDVDKRMEATKKELVRTLLIATNLVMQRELAEVIAGRKNAKDCALLPKNIHGLEKLVNMLTPEKPQAGTVIQGQNVQVINNQQLPQKVSKSETNAMLEVMGEITKGDEEDAES
jgi:hypothetical protein